MISDEFLLELKYHNDIEDVLSSYINLKRRGRNLVGLCPFHSEKTPSFTVYPESQSYYCFGCGSGGDVVTFIRNVENLEYVEAVKFLAKRAGMTVPEDVENDKTAQKKTRILALNRECARFFYVCLNSPFGKKAMDYILNRGLTPKTIKKFGLGFAPDSWDGLLNHLKKKGFNQDEMYEAAVVAKSQKGRFFDSFRNRVMFPIIDLSGNVIAFGGRQLDDKRPKYLNSADTPVFKKSRNLFAMNIAKGTREQNLILCEGYMDVISMHQAGFTNAVATLGTALTSEQAKLIARYKGEVVLSYDSDEAGQKATKRAREIVSAVGLKAKVLKIQNAKDPDEFIKKFGAARFKMLIEGSSSATDYELSKIKEKYDIKAQDGKLSYIKDAVAFVATLSSEIERDIYTLKISEETGVSKDAVENAVKSAVKRKYKAQETKKNKEIIMGINQSADKINPERAKNIKAAVAEENLILSVYKNPDFIKVIDNKIKSDDFVTAFNRKVFETLCSLIREHRTLDISVITKDLTTAEAGYITKILVSPQSVNYDEKQMIGLIDAILSEKSKKSNEQIAEMNSSEFDSYIKNMKASKK